MPSRPPRALRFVLPGIALVAVLGGGYGALRALKSKHESRLLALASIPAHLERLGFPQVVEPPADGSWVWASPGRPLTWMFLDDPLEILGLWRGSRGWQFCRVQEDGKVSHCEPVNAQSGLDPGVRVRIKTSKVQDDARAEVVPLTLPLPPCDTILLSHFASCEEVERIKVTTRGESWAVSVASHQAIALSQAQQILWLDQVADLALVLFAPVSDEQPYGLLAIDVATGRERWRTGLPRRGAALSFGGYAKTLTSLVVAHGGALTLLDLATGQLRGTIGPLPP